MYIDFQCKLQLNVTRLDLKMLSIRKRSPLWNHFSQVADNKAKCVYCAQTLNIPNKSIGNMSRHMKLKHPTIQINLSRQVT